MASSLDSACTSILLAGAAAALLLAAPLAKAHHSYADFERDARVGVAGVITAVQWSNPHILLSIDDGEHQLQVEWVTIAGADKTGVGRDRFNPGDRIMVVGSRHRDPAVHRMARVQVIRLPQDDWVWVSPARGSRW